MATKFGTAKTPLYRQAPNNIEAEQALLGAILVNNDAFYRVSDFLKATHFYEPLHRRIFEVSAQLIRMGKLANPLTIRTFLPADEKVGNMTVSQYLATLAANAVTVIHAPDYGHAIYDLATRRALITVGEDMVNIAYDAPVDMPPSEQIENAKRRLFQLAKPGCLELEHMIPDQHLAAKAFKRNTSVPVAAQRNDLYQAANDAARALGLKGNCCSLLKTLVGFYRPNEGVKGLMVWPSNAKLIDALGVSVKCLRDNLRALREAGLIVARTSANGKRFPIKDRDSGKIKDAYGFDLSPLHARRHEFAAAVAAQDRSREELKARKAVLSATRRELKILRDGFAKLNLPDLQEQADRAAASALTPCSTKTTIEDVDQLLLAAESARTRLEQAYLKAIANPL